MQKMNRFLPETEKSEDKYILSFQKDLYLTDKILFFETLIAILFFFSLPFSETLKTITFLLLTFFFFLNRFRHKSLFYDQPFFWGLLIYLFSGLFISFFALDIRESLKGWLDFLVFFSVYLILINDFRTNKLKQIIEWSLIVSTFLSVLWGIIFWKILWHRPHLQIISLGYYNHTSIFLGLVLILNFCKLLWGTSLNKFSFTFLFISFLFLVSGLVFTTSRASLLGISCSLLFLLLYKGMRNKKIILFTFIFTIVALFTFLLSKDFQQRILNVGPVISRFHIWKAGLLAFKDHPIVGVGLRCFGKIDAKYYGKYIRDRVDHAHNVFINHLTQMGLIGFFALIALLYSAFITAYKAKDNYKKYAVYSSLVFVIVNGLFNTTLRWEHAIAFVTIVYLLDYSDEKKNSFY